VADFTPVGSNIRFGLSAVRNVGEGVVDGIVQAREEKGAFTSFSDFLDKVPVRVCNKRVIESLIKAGAFDAFPGTRRALVAIHEEAVDAVMGVKRNEAAGQFDLFGGLEEAAGSLAVEIPDLPEWNKSARLAFERDMLGLYVSDHPLSGLETGLASASTHGTASLADAEATPDGTRVKMAGLLTNLQRKTTKKGALWASASLEDLDGSVEVMFFQKTYLAYAEQLAEDLVVAVSGRLARREEQLAVYVQEMRLLDLVPASGTAPSPLEIVLPANRATEAIMGKLERVLRSHPGASPVHLRLTTPTRTTVVSLNHGIRVDKTDPLYADLKATLGANCVV
jgi:DNA polymerase-3 subunit alpha